MRILKILLISTALAAFGAGAALAQSVPTATTGETTAKPKTKKVVKRTVVKKKVAKTTKATKKKVVVAKATKKKTPSTDSESAPGSPPPSGTTN